MITLYTCGTVLAGFYRTTNMRECIPLRSSKKITEQALSTLRPSDVSYPFDSPTYSLYDPIQDPTPIYKLADTTPGWAPNIVTPTVTPDVWINHMVDNGVMVGESYLLPEDIPSNAANGINSIPNELLLLFFGIIIVIICIFLLTKFITYQPLEIWRRNDDIY